LRPGVGVAGEIRKDGMASRPRRYIEGVDDELSGHRSRGLPADDAPTKDIGDEGDVNNARPRRAVGEVRHP